MNKSKIIAGAAAFFLLAAPAAYAEEPVHVSVHDPSVIQTEDGEPDGKSTRNTRWDNDYLNLNALIVKGSANGGIDEVSDKWFTGSGDWDNTYGPNAIDPRLRLSDDHDRRRPCIQRIFLPPA